MINQTAVRTGATASVNLPLASVPPRAVRPGTPALTCAPATGPASSRTMIVILTARPGGTLPRGAEAVT